MRSSDLALSLARLIQARRASTFFLNGAPGSGKSYLLRELAGQLPIEVPHSQVLGPYLVAGPKVESLGQQILQDCAEAGFLDASPPANAGSNLTSAWQWLGKNMQTAAGQSFLVLIDLTGDDPPDLTTSANLFSSARYLEGAWSHPGLRIFHMFAGFWDQSMLEQHYQDITTSFPYTIGHNHAIWDGLGVEEMVTLTGQARPGDAQPIHGRILFELTGGHPAAALDILDRIAAGQTCFPAILEATGQAAAEGSAGRALLRVWCQLPIESRIALRDLVLGHRIPVITLPPHLESLYVAGAVRKEQIGAKSYLGLRSWYTELLVFLHAKELGIADERIQKIRIAELMPQALELNAEAYRLIRDIEVQARNFVAVQLCLTCDSDQPILKNRPKKYDVATKAYVDVQQRALDWQKYSAGKGLPVALNPLLAYLRTRDLADLIAEIGVAASSKSWLSIANAIRELSDVRDAVMHNQLIDDAALQRLYDLQAEIHEALCLGA